MAVPSRILEPIVGGQDQTPLGYSLHYNRLVPEFQQIGDGDGGVSPISASRGRGRGSVPAPGQIGDGGPVPVPGQIGDGDGDGDRGVRALGPTVPAGVWCTLRVEP